MSGLVYVGSDEAFKTTSLGWCRVTPQLLKDLTDFCENNGEKNRSAFIRKIIRNAIGKNSIKDIIESEKPFMKRGKQNGEKEQ